MRRVLTLALALALVPPTAIEAAAQCAPDQMQGRWRMYFSEFPDSAQHCKFLVVSNSSGRIARGSKCQLNGDAMHDAGWTGPLRVARNCEVRGTILNTLRIRQATMVPDGSLFTGLLHEDANSQDPSFPFTAVKIPR